MKLVYKKAVRVQYIYSWLSAVVILKEYVNMPSLLMLKTILTENIFFKEYIALVFRTV